MSKINTLKAHRAALVEEIQSYAESESFSIKTFNRLEKDLEGLDAQIESLTKAQNFSAAHAKPVELSNSPKFKDLGENLLAIRSACAGGRTDPRLVKAPTGLGETDPQFGGFTIQSELANSIVTRIYSDSVITDGVRKVKIGPNSNGFKQPMVNETSRATGSRFGGVNAYWLDEGSPLTASRPKLKMIDFNMKKIAALWYVTDEMLSDSTLLSSLANDAFALELNWQLADSILNGNGIGKPLGFNTSLNGGLVVQPGETGQKPGTIVYENIINMYSKLFAPHLSNACWLVHQSCLPQLMKLSMPIGTAGYPMWQPANLAQGAPNNTLLGLPVHIVEQVPALGSQGCVTLVDLGAYQTVDREGPAFASSMHVNFLVDEMVYRVVYRIDGAPLFQAPVTSANGNINMSAYIALAAI